MKKILIFALLLSCFTACSEGSEDFTADSVYTLFNNMKGSYSGKVITDGGPQDVTVRIGTDFTIERLPTAPILRHAIKDQEQLSAALMSTKTITYTAEFDSLDITGSMTRLKMLTTDIIFTTKTGNVEHNVAALTECNAYTARMSSGVTVMLNVKELFFDGMPVDVKTERIEYLIDNAIKLEENNNQ